MAKSRELELQEIIQNLKLKDQETRKFLDNAFLEGEVTTVGTEISSLMPTVSRFGLGGNRDAKKQEVIQVLKNFFDKYSGIGRLPNFSNPDSAQNEVKES